MYGLIHSALRQMIVDHHGEETWHNVLIAADVPIDSFLTMRSYDDSVTYALAGAAAEVLNAPLDTALELFGEYWMTRFAPRSYDQLLDAAGVKLFDFLENLDALHDRISTTFVGYVPPSFQLERLSETTGILHYRSSRQGMVPFVIGLIKGMQVRFGVDICIEDVSIDQTPAGDRATISLSLGQDQ